MDEFDLTIHDHFPEPEHRISLSQVAALSPFFKNTLLQNPDLFSALKVESVSSEYTRAELRQRYADFVDSRAESDLPTRLRLLRAHEMMRVVYRDLTRLASLAGTTFELSILADFCISAALDHYTAEAVEKYGGPVDENDKPVGLSVLAMGKLGAFELNLSSDVDLIFFYETPGNLLQANGKVLSHQEFFLRVARQLIACLDDATTIGNVFRCDMRLRPYGESGPLVLHRAAMEKYYVEQGREWERYAFIKARANAGDIDAGTDFLDWLKPFVYRKHLDYGAVQSLREMKGLIARQVELKELDNDVKLGPGGIREVEFIAQAHQLIWGGKYEELQTPPLMRVLPQLQEKEFLSRVDVEGLTKAYIFLRNSEHAIQAEYDRQTHRLPEGEESQRRLATAMGFDDYESYVVKLTAHRGFVSECFGRFMDTNSAHGRFDKETGRQWTELWQDPSDGAMAACGFAAVQQDLYRLKADIQGMELQELVAERVDSLVPIILMMAASASEPAVALARLLPIVRAVLRRSTYLVFLSENLDALERIVALVTISTWIADQLSSYPILLYELTNRSIHEVSVTKMELEGELREELRLLDQGDLESQMDTLRQFKLAATLKIAALELLNEVSIMEASDGLTALAEVILDAVLELARYHLEAKHGLPCDESGSPLDQRLAIVAYGKAGGMELAYGSDLDLVFLGPSNIHGVTDGKSPINNNAFFLRLGQRVIHILASFTRFGILYTADLRLRPQGNKGPLVATVNAFERYQDKEAWTWEHQALIRARFVAGDPQIGVKFAEIRKRTLARDRDRGKLLSDVIDMRERMRAHLATGKQVPGEEGIEVLGKFDLKHDSGAIVDIEFMVQYAVLAWAASYAQLDRWTDVMRLLDELGAVEVFTEAEVSVLQRAYLAFRAAIHHQWLGLEIDFEQLQGYRQDVFRMWESKMDRQVIA